MTKPRADLSSGLHGHYRSRFCDVAIVCKSCGDQFFATRPDAKTCSPRCRKALSRGVNKSMEEFAQAVDGKGGRS